MMVVKNNHGNFFLVWMKIFSTLFLFYKNVVRKKLLFQHLCTLWKSHQLVSQLSLGNSRINELVFNSRIKSKTQFEIFLQTTTESKQKFSFNFTEAIFQLTYSTDPKIKVWFNFDQTIAFTFNLLSFGQSLYQKIGLTSVQFSAQFPQKFLESKLLHGLRLTTMQTIHPISLTFIFSKCKTQKTFA